MPTEPKRLGELLAVLRSVDGADQRAELLIDLSTRFCGVAESVAVRPYAVEHRVPGCESEVYLWAGRGERGIDLHFAVENPQGISAKALAVILTEIFADLSPEEISAIDAAVVYEIFGRTLSMGKAQGLTNMVRMARASALALSNQH